MNDFAVDSFPRSDNVLRYVLLWDNTTNEQILEGNLLLYFLSYIRSSMYNTSIVHGNVQ